MQMHSQISRSSVCNTHNAQRRYKVHSSKQWIYGICYIHWTLQQQRCLHLMTSSFAETVVGQQKSNIRVCFRTRETSLIETWDVSWLRRLSCTRFRDLFETSLDILVRRAQISKLIHLKKHLRSAHPSQKSIWDQLICLKQHLSSAHQIIKMVKSWDVSFVVIEMIKTSTCPVM